MNANEIMQKYTAGEMELAEANEQLKEAGATYHLDSEKNVLTEEDLRATTIGHYPDQANGYGLLDTGTGTLDKVEVKNGRLVNTDCGEMYALCIIAGRTYEVKGTELVEPTTREEAKPVIPDRPDMSRKTELAGQTVRQDTKQGVYDVHYNADGYAVSAERVKF